MLGPFKRKGSEDLNDEHNRAEFVEKIREIIAVVEKLSVG